MNIGTASTYTVGNYDGMVLMIDSYGGKVRVSVRNKCEYMLTSPGWRHPGIHE